MSRRTAWLLGLTPVILLVTHYLAVFPHEFTHSFVAWFFGVKDNPLLIEFGDANPLNVLLLWDIWENVDYQSILATGKGATVAFIAFSGPFIANGGLYLLSRWAIRTRWVVARPVAIYVLFWFLVINLANLFDYVPVRAFASDGDIRHIIWGTGWSPWLIYVVVGYLVLWGFVDLYRNVLPQTLAAARFEVAWARGIVAVIAVVVPLAYFSVPGIMESDDVSVFISWTSWLLVPVVLIAIWRRTVIEPRWVLDDAEDGARLQRLAIQLQPPPTTAASDSLVGGNRFG